MVNGVVAHYSPFAKEKVTRSRNRVVAMKPHLEFDTPAINHDELIGRMMGSAQMAQRMLDKFVEASRADCDELESIVRLGNANEIASLAHRHKGTAQTMAAPLVVAISTEIEARATTDPTSDLLELVEQLRQSHREVRELVELGVLTTDTQSEQS